MENSCHERFGREYELARPVSLRQIDPIALLTLKATGGTLRRSRKQIVAGRAGWRECERHDNFAAG
jgi:hypothetical protein